MPSLENPPRQQPIKRVLLIDDDADDRKYFLEVLHAVDPSAIGVTVNDGIQALKLLNDESLSLPDFIFLDLRMPRMSGRQFLVELKADHHLKDIPVIIYSTTEELVNAENLEQLGEFPFLSKPGDFEELYYVLGMTLRGHWNFVKQMPGN